MKTVNLQIEKNFSLFLFIIYIRFVLPSILAVKTVDTIFDKLSIPMRTSTCGFVQHFSGCYSVTVLEKYKLYIANSVNIYFN